MAIPFRFPAGFYREASSALLLGRWCLVACARPGEVWILRAGAAFGVGLACGLLLQSPAWTVEAGGVLVIALGLVAFVEGPGGAGNAREICRLELREGGQVEVWCLGQTSGRWEGPLLSWERSRCCLGCSRPFEVYTLRFASGSLRVGTPMAPSSFADVRLPRRAIHSLLRGLGACLREHRGETLKRAA